MWQRHGEKEGCRDERDANWKKKKKRRKSQVPSLTAFCINYRTPHYYTLPTPTPSPDWSPLRGHRLVFFPNLSEICLFKHPLKDRSQCSTVITKDTVISIIIMISEAELSHCRRNHKRPKPWHDYEVLHILMLLWSASWSDVAEMNTSWSRQQWMHTKSGNYQTKHLSCRSMKWISPGGACWPMHNIPLFFPPFKIRYFPIIWHFL